VRDSYHLRELEDEQSSYRTQFSKRQRSYTRKRVLQQQDARRSLGQDCPR
jgi:hypothetical protein